jgi:hypothetical protein
MGERELLECVQPVDHKPAADRMNMFDFIAQVDQFLPHKIGAKHFVYRGSELLSSQWDNANLATNRLSDGINRDRKLWSH